MLKGRHHFALTYRDRVAAFRPRGAEEAVKMRTYQVQEVAKLLGVARSTVYDMARLRKIPHRRIGTGRGRIVFTEEDVQQFLDSSKVEALSLPSSFPFTHGK